MKMMTRARHTEMTTPAIAADMPGVRPALAIKAEIQHLFDNFCTHHGLQCRNYTFIVKRKCLYMYSPLCECFIAFLYVLYSCNRGSAINITSNE